MEGGGISMKPPGGDNKPKMSDKLGSNEHAAQSNLASGQGANNGSSNSPMQSGSSSGPSKTQKIGNKASELSETAKDLKDIAKAGPTGLESTGKEIKEGAQKGGAKGAAAAAGREAAGQAVGVAATALTAGALAEVQGKIAKAVSKGLKKENLKKIALGIAIVLIIPLIVIGILVGVIIYAAHNPAKFLETVLTTPKSREFATQAAKLVGKNIIGEESTYKKYGYVEYRKGSAIAAPTVSISPKPGSIEEKILKINIKNAKYQTNSAPTCPYTYTTKDMIGPDGKNTSVIDTVKNNKGEVVDRSNFLVDYCIVQSMPLYNMMVRTQKSRDVNSFSGTVLNYADSSKSDNLKNKTSSEIKKYVYNKTYQRITNKDSGISISNPQAKQDIESIKAALKDGGNPDSVQYIIDANKKQEQQILETLCSFAQGYLSSDNLNSGILSRLNTGQRSGMKWNTIASTRQLDKMSNAEFNPTFNAVDGWQSSRAYSQNVYGSQNGEAIDPQRLSNTSYGSSYVAAISILSQTKKDCSTANDNSFWSGVTNFFTNDKGDAKDRINNEYNLLRKVIVNESNGKFTSINDFGLQQLMDGVITLGGGSAVSGLESGPQNFNNQSQGFRALSNQYMARIGGRFLTKEEYSQVNALTENTVREIERKSGLAYRIFGKDNLRSIANVFNFEAPRTNNDFSRKSKQIIATLSNPIKMVADLHYSFSYIVLGKTNQAFAADSTGDAYMRLDTIGLPSNDFENVDLIANSNEIQDMIQNGNEKQKTLLGYFDKCSKANIPSENLFIRQYSLSAVEKNINNVDSTGTPIKDGSGNPIYPSFTKTDGDGNIVSEDFSKVGFTNKNEFMACEIYMMPKNQTTQRDIISRQSQIYGVDALDLSKKYHLYLYANSIVDLMVELSNTEKTTAIYSNGLDSTVSNVAQTVGAVGDIGMSSDNVPCPPGTNDLGVVDSQYTGSLKKENGVIKIRLCQIPDIPGQGNNTSGAEVSGGAIVNSRVAGAWLALAKQAKSDGISLTSSSSFRLGDSCGGTGDGSVCARPGSSPHQLGVAIDFSGMNKLGTSTTSCTGRAKLPDNPAWKWMFDNAERWGIEQYTNEAWHWDLTGSENRCNSKE